MTPTPFVSIIVPARDEEAYICRCLESLLATDYPVDRFEILVVDGRSEDRTRKIVAEYATRKREVCLLDNPRRTAPAAMNIGIRHAAGDVILRADAHSVYPPEYVPRLVAALVASGADNVGGLMVTVPANETATARAIAAAMSHPFGVGNAYFRIGTTTSRWVDTVPFGCYRADVFKRIGMFDEQMVRNQDDELNFRLVTHGGRILLVPDVAVRYYGRSTLKQVARMFYQYGRFKPVVARKVGRVVTIRQLVPAMFVLALATTGVAAVWWPASRLGLAALLGSYALAVLGCAATSIPRLGRAAAMLAAVFPAVHVGYGLGFLVGLAGALRGADHAAPRPSAVPLTR
jgi:glycosyltransferase involved in cell wall biosynthesis